LATLGSPATEINLAWADNTPYETEYRIDVDSTPNFINPIAAVILVPANTTSYAYSGFTTTTYYFRVVAVTATLQSDPSNVVTITTGNPPPTPSGFTATVASSSQVDLTWFDVFNETSYRLERSTDGGVNWSTLVTLPANTTSHSDTGLTADTQYSYRLFATNADGDSAPAGPQTVTTQVNISIDRFISGANVGRFTSIALFSPSIEAIAHYDVTNTNVLLTTYDGAFTTSTVDTGPTGTQDVGGSGTAIAIDSSGFFHIAAQDVTNATLRYITNAGGSTVATTIDSVAGGFLGHKPRMAYHAATSTLYIAYHRFPPASSISVRVATKVGAGAWTFEDIPLSVDASSLFSLSLDPSSGAPHLALTQASTTNLYHAVRTGPGAWTLTQIPVAGGSPYPIHTAIAIDAAGFPHVAYFEFFSQDLFHATNAGGSWVSEFIHQTPSGLSAGWYPSVAIDQATGRIHVAYFDDTNDDLRYARKDPGGTWVLKLLDAAGLVGSYTSMVLDSTGAVHIGYYDETNGDLKRASGTP
jgi:hypothetical protein